MRRRRAVPLLLLLAAGAGADIWSPYGERIAFSEHGNRYLITRRVYQPRTRTTFELCERKLGTPGPTVVRKPMKEEAVVTRGPQDRVLAQGEFDDPPLDVWVLEGARAAILFEEYGHIGFGNTIARLDEDGKLRWAVKYRELDLPGVEPIYTTGSIMWQVGWWVDEARGRVVLVAKGGAVQVVDLETGKLTPGDDRVVLESMQSPSPLVRWRVFELCPATLARDGWKALAHAALADEKLSASTRLAASLALHRAGGAKPDPALFLATVKERSRRDTIADHVLYAATRIVGADAAPALDEYARRFGIQSPRLFAHKLLECGDAGIPLLVRLARGEGPKDARWYAAHALGRVKTTASRAAFVRLVRSGGIFPSFDDPALAAALAESLRTPGHGDAAIAQRLAKRPKPEYAAPLAVALARHEKGSPEHDAIAAALGACK